MGSKRTDELAERLRLPPGKGIALRDRDAGATAGWEKGPRLEARLRRNLERIDALQYRLYADRSQALLIVLQAMDAGGKDGVIRHVMGGFNPQGCAVTSFKAPSEEESAHDFLWRIHEHVPRRGDVGIFNRSHYEDVLVVRVRRLVPKEVWSRRYHAINEFEKHLTDEKVVILKFFLHVSKQEQRKRLQARIDDPERQWKFSAADLEERRRWPLYQKAYEEMLERCGTPWAPWHVIPADHKWFRNLAVSEVILRTLESMKLRFPRPQGPIDGVRVR